MPIPEAERTIYRNNPLFQVICQIRFPSILKIESDSPASFQERIRKEYPIYEEVEGFDKSKNIPPEIFKAMGKGFFSGLGGARRVFKFSTEDKKWTITLEKDSLGLDCNDYRRWEEFEERFKFSFQVCREEYEPAFFTRIGLRYRNIINREKIGLKGENWAKLLNTKFSGAIGWEEFSSEVQGTNSEILLNLDNRKNQLRVRHGLVRVDGISEDCYLIDSDYSTLGKTEVQDVFDKLDTFRKGAGKFFRWCITDKLHNALGPTKP